MADKIISCFIDEAGDFGEFETHSPFYIVTIVVHEQNHSIQSDVDTLEQYLTSLGFPNHALHTGPLIRRESVYEDMNIEERRKLFNLLFRFARKLPIQFFTVKVRKSECNNPDILEARLARAIHLELNKHLDYWRSFDKIIIYYDNGQKPIKRILNVLFNSEFSNVEIRRISPANYKLFQVADLICSLEHINSKIEIGQFSNTETEFFISRREFKRNFMRKIDQQRL